MVAGGGGDVNSSDNSSISKDRKKAINQNGFVISSSNAVQSSSSSNQPLVAQPQALQRFQNNGKNHHSNQILTNSFGISSENRSDDANLSIPHIADFYPEGMIARSCCLF
jgi:hypothetical protein